MPLAALFMIVLNACAPTATPTPLPATPPPATVEAATSTPTTVPVNLSGPEAGALMVWLDNAPLVYIPAGEFFMGTGIGDAPKRTVTLDAFWIQQTEVTNSMYAQCVKVGSCTPPVQEIGAPFYNNPEFASYPVVGVDWNQATAYCNWIQGRLPTEAEWEKAARGAEGNIYPWGNDGPACDVGNFVGCGGHTSSVTDHPDGRSPYGLYDMAGNVFEWVNDWYDASYYENAPSQNPTGPDSGQYRVIRGSSFETDFDQIHSGIRHFGGAAWHDYQTGFRCVVPQPQPIAPYCQLSAYVPGGSASNLFANAECQLPAAQVRGNYCAGGESFATVDLPEGVEYQVVTRGFKCSEAIVDGARRLTCQGPRFQEATGEITVCNAQCSGQPDISGGTITCDPGYKLDAERNICLYSPVSGQPDVAGCPVGYNLVDRGGQKLCVPGLSQNGLCPIGEYFDKSYGACVPANGRVDMPYGLNNADLASQTYAGCAAGYTYDPTYQCCQANTGGAYPSCAPGSKVNADIGACAPGDVRLAGPGCVTVSITTLQCAQPKDICSPIKTESVCLRNSYACRWDDKQNVCMLKK
jgi:formylglycine-generating enzyme required for sulfatase activity